MWTTLIAALIAGLLVHYAHTIANSKLRGELEYARYVETSKSFAAGYDAGWSGRGEVLYPFVNQDEYEKVFMKPFEK